MNLRSTAKNEQYRYQRHVAKACFRKFCWFWTIERRV